MPVESITPPSADALRSAALEYAGRGWAVIPVHSVRNGACTCTKGKDCDQKPGKHPRTRHGSKDGSTDPDAIRGWWWRWQDANIGIVTGRESGIVVLDMDPAHGGDVSLAALEGQHGGLPDTWTVRTGGGGMHYYFLLPPGLEVRCSTGLIADGLDMRGEGGYILAPPSLHASGRRYEVMESAIPPVELPAWLLGLAAKRPSPNSAAHQQKATESVTKGKRTLRLVSLAGTMHKRCMIPKAIEAALLAQNATFSPPLPDAKVRKIARDIPARYPLPEEANPNEHAPGHDASEQGSGATGDQQAQPTAPPLTKEKAATLTSELLVICLKWILRFVVLAEAEAIILAFWLLHSWAFGAAVTTPYMFVKSAEKESGKTTLLKVLKAVARLPMFSSSISPAALARVVGKDKPSLFLDELDAQMKGERERAQDIRGVLDSGYEIDGTYTRCMGKNHDVVSLPTFCPKVLAGIGELWDTVESRSIHIEMRRRLPHEVAEPLRTRRIQNDANPIKQSLQDWVNGGIVEHLKQIEVADVSELGDRQMDISEPLLQIAQLAANEWPAELISALKTVFHHGSQEDDGSTSVLLLNDIRDIFAEPKKDEIPSRDLVAALNEIEGRPWAEWSKGRGLSPNNLARLLRKYHIYPTTIRLGDATPKGYRRADFRDAWERYCPNEKNNRSPLIPLNSTATTQQPASPLNKTPFSNRNTNPRVADEKSGSNPHEQRSVAGVAVQNRADEKKGENTESELWI